MDAKRFLPECNVDTLLVQTILQVRLQSKSVPNHKKNINKVVEAMNTDYSELFCVGIVDIVKDFDKHKKDFSEIATHEDHLVLYKHDTYNQFMVYIRNGIEKFIWNNCQKFEIDLTVYHLPNTYDQFKFITKRPQSWTDEQKANLQLLFKYLIKQENSGFFILSNWLQYLYTKAEASLIEEIQQI